MSAQTGPKYHSAVAFVRDIEAAKKFYSEVLGMTVELDFGMSIVLEGGLGLWQIYPGHVIPEKLGADAISNRGVNRFEFYFETEDIEKDFEKLQESGTELLHPLQEEPWGQRNVRFFDPDRHVVEIGETLETFVRRLHEQGMTAEQVSDKTSIPVGNVSELLGG